MSEIEKMERYIKRTKLDKNDRFFLTTPEAFELAHKAFADTDFPIETIVLAFNYGKAKGYRAARAKFKEAI